MRVGIVSPVVTTVPGSHAPWERSAGITELVEIAKAADALGFDHLTCSEHVAVPTEVAQQRGATYWDPLATFGHLAAHTSRIRFATQVLVLGYHHPLEIAKRYGTLDLISGGRLVLGLGVGSLEEEFALLGARFAGRGAVADEAIAALRASLSRREPTFHGEHFDYSGFVVEPHAQQERVPLWVGGRTPRSLRRATTHADGWVPFGLSLDQLRSMLDATDLPDDFEVVLGPGRPLDPGGDPAATTARLTEVRRAGATLVSTAVRSQSPAHYLEQLEALARLASRAD
ncbi:LLM class F420-dependent oxidoreductase [Nocardioides sp.]|uniref:LLM class F420-dependent oxidoreductase n=1 Tax=Nocardioides sp. TaxID=35761 RepID=UPI0027350AA4|nr:LLM class F420-dependent oxidoreductase [Nocardioides sp.]MDP3892183.1 LLM class F420-dependent oxidoreductase [Nocardioides sp.]